MSASTNDKITDVRNAARPNSARVTSGRSAGGTTLACDNLSGWPTTSKVHFVTYKIDSSSAVVAGTQLDCYGIVSGNNIGSFTVVDGSDTGHAVGDVVEMLPTAAWGQDLADALSIGHERTGVHKANLPLTTPVLTTPTIADFTSAVHTHANNAGGGQLIASALGTDSSWAWQSWTPTVTLAGGTTNGNAVITGKYTQIGKTIHYIITYTVGTTTNFSGLSGISFSPPVNLHTDFSANSIVGVGLAIISGAGYPLYAQATSASSIVVAALNAASTYLTSAAITASIPAGWGIGSTWNLSGSYEAA